jgi:glycerophosphoryl diester phosphodiesterase
VVVAPDPTGARTAGVPTAIRAASLGEVRRWDVGWGFRDARGERPFAGRGYRVPTLDEVLTEFPGVRLNVDLKAHTAAMVDATIAAVRRHGAEDHVLLTSFDSATLRAVRRRGYAGPTGLARNEILLLFLTPLAALARVGVPGQAVQIPPRVGLLALDTRPWIARCHALGLRVDYWVINEPAEARRLLALGADGIVTDDPAAIAPVFREA